MLLKEDHIDDVLLEQKILDLFEYRLFPDLIRTKVNSFEPGQDGFYDQLTELQKRIYYLDAHLEAHTFPDEQILNKLWVQIFEYLSIFGIQEADLSHYTRHIARYQKHELDLRNGKLPMRLSMEYFYYYKSCDVKLLRRLIYEKYQIPDNMMTEGEWKNYDLITEVNDDIADLNEDMGFINGNSFLISLLVYGRKKTEKLFTDFIHDIKREAQKRLLAGRNKNSFVKRVHELTVLRCDETLSLLSLTLDRTNEEELQNALLNTSLLKRRIHEKSGY